MSLQVHKNGTGYVVHGITGSWAGRVSAWFDADWNLVDASQWYWRGRVSVDRQVKRGGPMWEYVREWIPQRAARLIG